MQHPTIVSANANERLNTMLQEAKIHRRMKRVAIQKTGSNFWSNLKERITVLKGQRLDKSAKPLT